MSLGASIFLSVVLLSVVLLFIATKDRWKWKKIVLFFIAGLITICVLVGCGFWWYTQPGDGITDMGETPLYCGDCPDAAKNADKACEVPNGGAGGKCNWTIQNTGLWPTQAAQSSVSFADACDETDTLGCFDIDETYCARIQKSVCTHYDDVYAFKQLSTEGLTGHIYLQFYVKIMAPPIDVDCAESLAGVWNCEACGSGEPMTSGHDVELIGFTPGRYVSPGVYTAMPTDYSANVYVGLHNHGGQLTLSVFHYTTHNNHKPGNITIDADNSDWIGVRLHIYNSSTAGADYYEWWADWNNDGVWTSMGSTLDGYHSAYGGDHAVTDPITFAHPFKYIYIGQSDLEGSIDFQITGIKVNTTGFPAGCTKTDTTVNELASIETPVTNSGTVGSVALQTLFDQNIEAPGSIVMTVPNLNIGTRFQSSQTGTIKKICFYKDVSMTGT